MVGIWAVLMSDSFKTEWRCAVQDCSHGRAHLYPGIGAFRADGALPVWMAEAGFRDVREAEVVSTVNGSISGYVARRAWWPQHRQDG